MKLQKINHLIMKGIALIVFIAIVAVFCVDFGISESGKPISEVLNNHRDNLKYSFLLIEDTLTYVIDAFNQWEMKPERSPIDVHHWLGQMDSIAARISSLRASMYYGDQSDYENQTDSRQEFNLDRKLTSLSQTIERFRKRVQEIDTQSTELSDQ